MNRIYINSCLRRFCTINLLLCSIATMLLLPVDAYAFKVETHVWVGQQVINDLEDDGMISIDVGGTPYNFSIPADVIDAILANKSEYRMGNIGPDAFPDILSGQTAVHPGVDGGWKTDSWLSWLKQSGHSAKEKAFVYGYLAHAAADTFAHTYVNQYSGDIFNLFDGEIDVETRHIILESFIKEHTPPLVDINGASVGQPYNVLSTPSTFLRDTLVFNNTVAGQNRKAGLYHLSLIYELRNGLQDLLDGPIRAIEILSTQAAAKELAGITLNNEQAQRVLDLAQQIHDLSQNELIGGAIDTFQDLNNQFNAAVESGIQKGTEIYAKITTQITDAQYQLVTLNGNLIKVVNQLAKAQSDLLSAQNQLDNTVMDIITEDCHCHEVASLCGVKIASCGTEIVCDRR